MTNSRVQQIFAEAAELSGAKRNQYLGDACSDDPAIRAEVESLLAAHEGAGKFMASPTSDFVEPVSPAETMTSLPEEPGSVIDQYKLLECIGEGGFGVVYMAQQSEPIRRRVALKIIKLGMDTKQVVARFEAERQALAMMDHPNIARVIDGGATENGRPYFVMELVRGDPITQYCDRERLTTQQRLELFQQVCHAVQHAHQKGIIHRDIKPSNVLVTVSDDKPLVKVIDFGIAKATNSELTEKTLFTEFRQLIGTPQYMSPEQAERSGVDVDTRTDVYSLGVLLYEMLTGSTPLDPKKLGSAAWHELQRIICEDEPTKPSTVVSSDDIDLAAIAKSRSTEPSRLGGTLKGDLDWIVLKALEKDRSRRYATASQFAEDIGRYLCDEAVEATPPSAAYKLSKFARRNKGLLAAASSVLAVLLIGLIATSVSLSWAMTERTRAMAALQSARDANKQAAQARNKARRSAIAAGAALLLPDDEARELAAEWQADLDQQRSTRPELDRELVLEETQFATWYTGWLTHHDGVEEAQALVAKYYDRAKQVLGYGDANFFGLCNASARAHLLGGSAPEKIIPIYEDLLPTIEQLHGVEAATALLPEYAGQLAGSGKDEAAASQITTYLARRAESGAPPNQADQLRLGIAMQQLIAWSEKHPKLFKQLKDYRETGATPGAADLPDDVELANDVRALQGQWVWKRWKQGKQLPHMMQEFDGNTYTTKFINDSGEVEGGYHGRFKLSRSGDTKVFTAFGDTSSDSTSFIYKVDPIRFTTVSGMLKNRRSISRTQMQVWERIERANAE